MAVLEVGVTCRTRTPQEPLERSESVQSAERGGVVTLKRQPSGDTQFSFTGAPPTVMENRVRAEEKEGNEEKG